jgi:hypothetical protein
VLYCYRWLGLRDSRKALTSASSSCKPSNRVLHIDIIRSRIVVTVPDLVCGGMMMLWYR